MEKQEEKKEILHDFKSQEMSMNNSKLIIIFFVVILAGIGSGYVLASRNAVVSSTQSGKSSSSVSTGTVVGSEDTKTFKDSAEGVLEEGGVGGEGQYHLVRPGGDSQNVYLTSSVVDLSPFVKKKVKVWGQTNTAKTAGWLMDVGRVEVLK